MYAIIEASGHQWKVTPGMRLTINRLEGKVGATHTVERVLFAYDGRNSQIGTPYLNGAKVLCEVVAHSRGPKVITYRYRRRENWRKTIGHRQELTTLIVKDIQVAGMAAAASAMAATEPASSKSAKAVRAPAKTPTVRAAAPKLPTTPRGAAKPASKKTAKE